jgi:GNAT superfamily N-acetyltransferase
MNAVIAEVNKNAIGEIRQIAYATWPVSYKEMISSSQIDYMLEMMYSEQSLREQFANGVRFLIASIDGKPAGFAGVVPKEDSKDIWRLEKLYVLPASQSKGLGKLLLDEVIKMVSEAGAGILELNVNRNNRALQFYRNMGFEIHEKVDLAIGGGFFMNDYILRKKVS